MIFGVNSPTTEPNIEFLGSGERQDFLFLRMGYTKVM